MSVVGFVVVLFLVFLCSGFRSPLSPLLCFIIVFVIIMHSTVIHVFHSEHMCIIWSYIRIEGEVSQE